MNKIAIQISNLSKVYLKGESRYAYNYRSLREDLPKSVKMLFGWLMGLVKNNKLDESVNQFWALKNINLKIYRGEKIGIIGRNGAGKSTLLKILSRITYPTEGEVLINGRIASLLEVGTGFHPELTGRENIFLNGAILGMGRAEISRKFNQIVDFAEIEGFIDTPVKRYSSGMYVRLAFSVAAHLEPDILVVDEVLSVGDMAFQKKCADRIAALGKDGCTIIFVSHSAEAVESLCDRVFWLESGVLKDSGPSGQIMTQFIKSLPDECDDASREVRKNAEMILRNIWISNQFDEPLLAITGNEAFKINIEFSVKKRTDEVDLAVWVSSIRGVPLFRSSLSDGNGSCVLALEKGEYRASFWVEGGLLVPDTYKVKVKAHVPNLRMVDQLLSSCTFTISNSKGDNVLYPIPHIHGVISRKYDWELNAI